jgi:hypothetical protein
MLTQVRTCGGLWLYVYMLVCICLFLCAYICVFRILCVYVILEFLKSLPSTTIYYSTFSAKRCSKSACIINSGFCVYNSLHETWSSTGYLLTKYSVKGFRKSPYSSPCNRTNATFRNVSYHKQKIQLLVIAWPDCTPHLKGMCDAILYSAGDISLTFLDFLFSVRKISHESLLHVVTFCYHVDNVQMTLTWE